jgi:hypothetical protein
VELSDVELRVLGCLVEKQMTTPATYPMTLNALVTACNQRSNRSPVVDYAPVTVDDGIERLRERGLARTVHGKGDRALKYRHVVDEVWRLDAAEVAVLAVLMLRGPQTPGELRARTVRYTPFAGVGAVEDTLRGLGRRDEPLVERMARRPGEKESRYRHLVGAADGPAPDEPERGAPADASPGRVGELEAEVAALQEAVARLEERLDRIEGPDLPPV